LLYTNGYVAADDYIQRIMQAASHFAIQVGGSTNMPRTSHNMSPVRHPGSIRVKVPGAGRRIALIKSATKSASAENVVAGILNSALDGVALLRPVRDTTGGIEDFRWIRINPEGERILGREADSLLGQRLLVTFPDLARSSGLLESWAAADGGKPLRHELQCLRDGMEGWIAFSVVGVDDGIAMTFRDITACRRDAAAVQEARLKADKAEHAKATFLAITSHELRTPLNGVVGALDLLDGCPNEVRGIFLDTARASARALSRVITKILDFTKLDAGTVEVHPVVFDLHELVDAEAAAIAPQAAAKTLLVESTIDRTAPRWVLGSPEHIRQILRALLENAVKFTDAGTVELTLARCSEPDVCGGPTACFSLTVSDTGIGIDPAFHTSLFQAFSQCDSSLTRTHEGCGLGLAICSRLADQLGGNLTVQSRPGQGSTFRLGLSLPVADCPGNIGRPETGPAPKGRILLADPGEASRMLTTLMLVRAGFEVETATGGLELLRAANLRRFDAVVMDMDLPDMSGVMTVKTMRKLPGSKGSVPIVSLTDSLDAYDDQRFLAAGITDLLIKPFSRSDLLDRLEHLIGSAANV
jgi:signal transduction histidine kinase